MKERTLEVPENADKTSKNLEWNVYSVTYRSKVSTPWEIELSPKGSTPRRKCPIELDFLISKEGEENIRLSIATVLICHETASASSKTVYVAAFKTMEEAKKDARRWLEKVLDEGLPLWMIAQYI